MSGAGLPGAPVRIDVTPDDLRGSAATCIRLAAEIDESAGKVRAGLLRVQPEIWANAARAPWSSIDLEAVLGAALGATFAHTVAIRTLGAALSVSADAYEETERGATRLMEELARSPLGPIIRGFVREFVGKESTGDTGCVTPPPPCPPPIRPAPGRAGPAPSAPRSPRSPRPRRRPASPPATTRTRPPRKSPSPRRPAPALGSGGGTLPSRAPLAPGRAPAGKPAAPPTSVPAAGPPRSAPSAAVTSPPAKDPGCVNPPPAPGALQPVVESLAGAYPALRLRPERPRSVTVADPAGPGLAGLAGFLAPVAPEPGRPDRDVVDVHRRVVTGADGRPREAYVVVLRGTSALDRPWQRDWGKARGIGPDLQLMAGQQSAEVAAMPEILRAAGVPDGASVAFVGHSQGGMTAYAAAGSAAIRSRYRVSHVVTLGSPVSRMPQPRGVKILNLENGPDLVPWLDGLPNPSDPDVTTARVHRPIRRDPTPHDIAEYVEVAKEVDRRATAARGARILHASPGDRRLVDVLDSLSAGGYLPTSADPAGSHSVTRVDLLPVSPQPGASQPSAPSPIAPSRPAAGSPAAPSGRG